MKPKGSRFFYGYWIVAIAFFSNFVMNATGMYGFQLFVPLLEKDFGWGRGQIFLAFTISGILIGLCAPFVGRIVDRYGGKWPIVIGGCLVGIGLTLMSTMQTLWQLYLYEFIVGLGFAGCGMVAATTMIANWFERRRGFALGLAGIGVGAGGFIMAPITGSILIPNLGWQTSFVVLGIIAVVLTVPITLIFAKRRPADIGLHPDGATAPPVKVNNMGATAATEIVWTLKMAARTPTFWLMTVSYVIFFFPMVSILQHHSPYLSGFYPEVVYSTALGAVGIGSAIGKFLFGWICDYIKPKYALAIGLGMQLAALLVLMNIGETSAPAMIWIYAALYGLGIGCWLPTMPMIIGTTFGVASFGVIYGVLTMAQQVISASGATITGFIYQTTGSYNLAFYLFIGLYLLAIALILMIRKPKVPTI